MLPALPSYRRFAEATIQRINKARKRKPSDRTARMLFNVLLLAGLWGAPLYARWVILADTVKDIDTPEQANGTIVGKWQATDGSHFSLTFTEDGQFMLLWKETILETAAYWFFEGDQEEIVIDNFREQPGDQRVEGDEKWWLRASVKGEKLSITLSLYAAEHFRRTTTWHKHRQKDGQHLKLPAVFERVE